MKPHILISIFIVLLCPFLGRSQVLYPPLNLQGEGVECSVYLTWDKPELPGGGTPPGLLGYNVYKEGNFFAYVSGQDTTWIYDIDPEPCPSDSHTYYLTAYYDLTTYGYPGQYGESDPTDTISVIIMCDRMFPFIEDWDMDSFDYLNWSFIPDQGNWALSATEGNPFPSAIFTGTPAVLNYVKTMQSEFIMTDKTQGCTNVFLDFDLKLENLVNSGSEKLIVETSVCEGQTDTVDIFENVTSFDWTHYRYTINQAQGTIVRIMFTATGQNSANIQQWLIDNIVVDFKCRPPVNVTGEISGNSVTLLWDPPVCDNDSTLLYVLTGYNIYMTDSTGMPPFHKINAPPCTDDSIVINLITGWDLEVVRFYITDLQHDSATWMFLCESEPSDTVAAHFVGIDPETVSKCNIYPNPNTGECTADLPPDAVSVVISDVNGRIVRNMPIPQDPVRQIRIDLRDERKGVYLIKIMTPKGISVNKIIKM